MSCAECCTPFVGVCAVPCRAVQYLVLGWGVSQGDQEVIIKLVSQLCYSARSEGGTTIVVLTQKEKLEMEDLFRWEQRAVLCCLDPAHA